jgi:hypothetical protein
MSRSEENFTTRIIISKAIGENHQFYHLIDRHRPLPKLSAIRPAIIRVIGGWTDSYRVRSSWGDGRNRRPPCWSIPTEIGARERKLVPGLPATATRRAVRGSSTAPSAPEGNRAAILRSKFLGNRSYGRSAVIRLARRVGLRRISHLKAFSSGGERHGHRRL